MSLRKELHFKNFDKTNLNELYLLANNLLSTEWVVAVKGKSYSISLRQKGWSFGYNKRKRSLGLCAVNKRVIFLSEYLVIQNLDNPKKLEDTLRHEIAHAIDYQIRGYSNHDKIWKSVANQVLCSANRCYNSSQIKDKRSKYTLICVNCKEVYARHRRPKYELACNNCCNKYNNGKYSRDYKLKLIQNY